MKLVFGSLITYQFKLASVFSELSDQLIISRNSSDSPSFRWNCVCSFEDLGLWSHFKRLSCFMTMAARSIYHPLPSWEHSFLQFACEVTLFLVRSLISAEHVCVNVNEGCFLGFALEQPWGWHFCRSREKCLWSRDFELLFVADLFQIAVARPRWLEAASVATECKHRFAWKCKSVAKGTIIPGTECCLRFLDWTQLWIS